MVLKVELGLGEHERGRGSHLFGLQTPSGSIPTERNEVLAVVPQEAVGHRPDQPLRPPGHLLTGHWARNHRPVHGVQQDSCSVREVFHRVDADSGTFGEHPEQQTRVGHHLLDPPSVCGQQGQDVWDQVRHAVFAQVDAEMSEESPRDLQQVSPLEPVRGSGELRGRVFELAARGARCRQQQNGEFDVSEDDEFLQEEGERV